MNVESSQKGELSRKAPRGKKTFKQKNLTQMNESTQAPKKHVNKHKKADHSQEYFYTHDEGKEKTVHVK